MERCTHYTEEKTGKKKWNKYHVIFFTGGPRPNKCVAEEMNTLTMNHFGPQKVKKIFGSSEIGNDGYYHYHICVALKKPSSTWLSCCEKMKARIESWPDKVGTQMPNVSAFYMKSKADQEKIMLKYLENPSKYKTTGEVETSKNPFCAPDWYNNFNNMKLELQKHFNPDKNFEALTRKELDERYWKTSVGWGELAAYDKSFYDKLPQARKDQFMRLWKRPILWRDDQDEN